MYRDEATVRWSRNQRSPVAHPDSPGSIDVFSSFPRVLHRRSRPFWLAGLWTLLGGLAERAGRRHLGLHVHGGGRGVGRLEYGLILTHHGQRFLSNRVTGVSVCHRVTACGNSGFFPTNTLGLFHLRCFSEHEQEEQQ